MTKTKSNKGLGNPAALALANSPEGKKAIGGAVETQKKLAEAGISLIPFLVKTGVVIGIAWYLTGKYKSRFITKGYNTSLPAANITNGEAESRADALYEAMAGWGADVELVADQLAGLNYNGWVKVYNAFGNREGVGIFTDGENLVEWITSEFDNDELDLLKTVLPNVF